MTRKTRKPTQRERARAFRFAMLVLSIGWDAAVRFVNAEVAHGS